MQRKTNKLDIIIGRKIYNERMARGWTMQQLASYIGVTHQQVAKYEKGANALSVTRLAQVAEIFNLPFEYFYEIKQSNPDSEQQKQCRLLLKNFMAIKSKMQRNAIYKFVKNLSAEQ